MAVTDNPSTPSVIIIGAGIGGLTTALHLHAHGIRNISVYETVANLKPMGVGINVQPHAVLILRDLGLLPALEATAIKTGQLNFYNKFGQPILSEPRGLNAGYKIPQISIHRGQFQMLLLDAVRERLGEDRVHFAHSFESFTQDESGGAITAKFMRRGDPVSDIPAQPISVTADLLIAADGINSTARRILYPTEGPPHFSGRILWRGCTERSPYLTGASMIWAGHANQKFIAYPISSRSMRAGKSLVNWICELRVRDEKDPDTTPPKNANQWLAAVPAERFLGPFEGWNIDGVDVAELVRETDKLYEFPMCDRNPVERWSYGRLTLLGDAAHPMYPIGSNGASQAILDAEALTKSLLANPKDIPAALKAYEQTRLPPTAQIVMANRANGPDHVMQVAHERAPDGFENIYDVIPKDELEGIGATYKKIAGFEKESVNLKAGESEGVAERMGLSSPRAWVV